MLLWVRGNKTEHGQLGWKVTYIVRIPSLQASLQALGNHLMFVGVGQVCADQETLVQR